MRFTVARKPAISTRSPTLNGVVLKMSVGPIANKEPCSTATSREVSDVRIAAISLNVWLRTRHRRGEPFRRTKGVENKVGDEFARSTRVVSPPSEGRRSADSRARLKLSSATASNEYRRVSKRA